MSDALTVQTTTLKGLWEVEFKLVGDDRGSVMEFYRQSDFEASGLPSLNARPQVNAPMSKKGTLRGIHAEFAHKFVSVAAGTVFAAIVDLRKDSQTAGQWESFELTRGQGLFVSSGLGNSFQSISDEPSIYLYCFEKEWTSDMPGVACNPLDPDLNISWPIAEGKGMFISEKDRNNPSLKEILS